MSKLKETVSMILALVLVFGLSTTALAAGSGYTITIENSFTDETYEVYRIFDATYNADSSGTTYYITPGSDWYTDVQSATSLFTLSKEDASGRYQVTKASDSVTAAQITAWIKNNLSGKTSVLTGTGNGGELELDVNTAGYYYITTATGSAVTLDTANPTAKVIDKNAVPGNPVKTAQDTELQIGQSASYTITADVPTYDGETKIANYTFTDVLSDGLTAPEASDVSVQILKSDGTTVAMTLDNVVTVDTASNTIIISYNPSSITDYPADAKIKITYSATVNTDAVYANGNTVTQTWTQNDTGETASETVYTFGFNLKKVIAGTDTQLEKAMFRLYTVANGGDPIKFSYDNTTNTYTVDPSGNVTDITVGYAAIFGLDSDVTYYLEEVTAPDGYNLLASRQSVSIDKSCTSQDEYKVVTLTQLVTVENNAGSVLPSTGGIGTTIFYIVGGALVFGAVVLLITRKRMKKAE